MDFTLIETGAYEELRALIIRISERIASLSTLSTRMQPDRWMTSEEVCKALHVSKRVLNYYRQQHYIPYSMLEKKVYYRESDIHKILRSNLMLPRQ